MSINLVLLALATTTSPLFVLAAVVMMSSSGRVRDAWAAVAGWMVSIGAACAVVMLIGGFAAGGARRATPWWMGAIDLALGLVLGVLAVREWRRSRHDPAQHLPKWYSRVGSMSIVAAFGVGLFLPANVLGYAAGNEIAQQHMTGVGRWLALGAYILIGSLLEAGPVLWFTLRPASRQRLLPRWNTWLTAHWQEVLAVLFTVIATFLLIKGGIALARSR